MGRRICIIQGHPDPAGGHYCHALAEAYADGAKEGGHAAEIVDIAKLDFDFVRTAEEWAAPAGEDVAGAQAAVSAADHLVIIYPLWLGSMPALLKAFLEQLCRAGFAIEPKDGGKSWTQKLKGKSARVIVTMGMPGQVYRVYFGAHSLKSLERNILRFAGVSPVRDTVIGMVEEMGAAKRRGLLARTRRMGARAL
ncbi:MAG: NAD(P)H-dependent oxidoreductase [Pseudomonadota bacterium]